MEILRFKVLLHCYCFLKGLTTKLFNRCLNKISQVCVQTVTRQLYVRFSNVVHSQYFTWKRFYEWNKKTIDLPVTVSCSEDIATRKFGHSSLKKSIWPLPWLEAIFLPEFPNNLRITEKDFLILNCIGKGTFSAVYRVCSKLDRKILFAMKKQSKSEILIRNVAQQVKEEASIHKSLSNSMFIAKCYASWQSRTHLFMVLQYATGYGDLFMLWRDYGPFAENTLRIYGAEIALALDYLHKNNIIYRDLKMENIVLDLDGHIQIVDFGFSKKLANGERTRTVCGTLQYMAPEIAEERFYSQEVDWWSYGVLLHVLNTNSYPFPNYNINSHTELRYDSYNTPCCEPILCDLFNKLLNVNIEGRMHTFVQLKSHPFFESIDWNEASLKKKHTIKQMHGGKVSQRMKRKEELKLNWTIRIQLMPFAHIEKLQRCPSCNSLYDKSGSDLSDTDVEENWAAFEERYEFNNGDYFYDQM